MAKGLVLRDRGPARLAAGPTLWFRLAQADTPAAVEQYRAVLGPMRADDEDPMFWFEAVSGLRSVSGLWSFNGDHWVMHPVPSDTAKRTLNRWLERLCDEGDLAIQYTDEGIAADDRTLLGYVFAQAANALTEAHIYRPCQYCRQPFLATRIDRRFCRNSHSTLYARRQTELADFEASERAAKTQKDYT